MTVKCFSLAIDKTVKCFSLAIYKTVKRFSLAIDMTVKCFSQVTDKADIKECPRYSFLSLQNDSIFPVFRIRIRLIIEI